MAKYIRHHSAREYGHVHDRGCEIGACALAGVEGGEVCREGGDGSLVWVGGLECGGLVVVVMMVMINNGEVEWIGMWDEEFTYGMWMGLSTITALRVDTSMLLHVFRVEMLRNSGDTVCGCVDVA